MVPILTKQRLESILENRLFPIFSLAFLIFLLLISFFSSPKLSESVPILQAFLDSMDFTGMEFDVALREFLAKFRLPGEAQKIDRIMECFAQRYFEVNAGVFPHQDNAYLLAFSLIMLNTDLHNPSIKTKITKEQFIKNNTNTGLEYDIGPDLLSKMYDAIKAREITLETEDTLFGNSVIVKMGWLTKQGGRIKTWKRRWFILSDQVLYYFKDKQESTSKACGIIPLENIEIRISDQKRKFCFELYLPNRNETIKAMKRSQGQIQKGHHNNYFIAADSKEEMESWMQAISENVFRGKSTHLIQLQSDKINRVALAKASPDQKEQQKLPISFTQLYDYGRMCSKCYKDQAVLLKSYPNAITEQPSKGFHFFLIIDNSSKTQTVVVCSTKWTLGAEMISDLSSKNNKLLLPESLGVSIAAKHIYNLTKKFLQKNFTTIVVGHSVGGCAALQLAALYRKKGQKIRHIITFGQPKDVLEKSLAHFDGLPLFRVVNENDPMLSLFPKCHTFGSMLVLLNGVHFCFFERSEAEITESESDGPLSFYPINSGRNSSSSSSSSNNLSDDKIVYNTIRYYLKSLKQKKDHAISVQVPTSINSKDWVIRLSLSPADLCIFFFRLKELSFQGWINYLYLFNLSLALSYAANREAG